MRIKLTLLLIVLVSGVTALAQSKADQPAGKQSSKAEQSADWRALFDGKTLNGWRGFHSDKTPAGWTVADGCIKKIKAQGELGQAGGDLITVDQFDNFEFQVDWKLAKGGNSGIKYLVSEDLPPTGKSAVSFEYQVLDDDNHPDAKMGIAGNRKAGSLYDVIPASSNKQVKPIGEFNQTRIVVKGNHIEHWLNGVKVVEFERGSEALRQRIAESKFKTIKGYGEMAKGHILLQDHGDEVWFCNLKIRELK